MTVEGLAHGQVNRVPMHQIQDTTTRSNDVRAIGNTVPESEGELVLLPPTKRKRYFVGTETYANGVRTRRMLRPVGMNNPFGRTGTWACQVCRTWKRKVTSDSGNAADMSSSVFTHPLRHHVNSVV